MATMTARALCSPNGVVRILGSAAKSTAVTSSLKFLTPKRSAYCFIEYASANPSVPSGNPG